MLLPTLRKSSFKGPEIMVFVDVKFSIIENLYFLPFPICLVRPSKSVAIYFFDLLNYKNSTFYNSLILSFKVGLIPVFSGLNPELDFAYPWRGNPTVHPTSFLNPIIH